MSNTYDVAIIGMGVAGVFCAHKLATQYKDCKVIGFELGRPPGKRRFQTTSFLGCLPSSDGKLFINDISKVANITGTRRANAAYKVFHNVMANVGDFSAVVNDKRPLLSLTRRFKKIGYDITLNDYTQTYPKDAHALSKYMANIFDQNANVSFSFDNELTSVRKQDDLFVISNEEQEWQAKKLVMAVGRAGWRWAKEMYESLGIIESNDIARYGVRIEMTADNMCDFKGSNCCLNKGTEVEIGPISWNGTVIPEDHFDTAIAAFRSNENRWKSDKVSFNLIGSRFFEGKGFEQTDRLAKLTFVITNDRIVKERVANIMNGKAKISVIPEYRWLIDTIEELSYAIPEIKSNAYYHAPCIIPMIPQINVGSDFSTEVDGLYVCGESSGISGILVAAMSGIIVAGSVSK